MRTITLEDLADDLVARHRDRRLIVGLAGAPGSGKSTLATRLRELIDRRRPGLSEVLPMDGYHYDDAVLTALGRLPRKGAPDTFDVGGFAHMLRRLAENEEETVAVPVFDRSIEIARAGGRLIARSVGILVVEGNYLLLARKPWDRLDGLFDVTVMVDVPLETLRRRLERRWRDYNIPADEARRKVEDNDLPNGRVVIAESRPADFVIENDDGPA